MSTESGNSVLPINKELSKEALKEVKKREKEDKKNKKLEKFENKMKNQQKSQPSVNNKPNTLVVTEKVEYTGNTKIGTKKDTSIPLPDKYHPKYVEAAWYEWWVTQGYFKPEYSENNKNNVDKFVVIIPPPNVTGTLHIGHALMCAIQDSIVRWNRMHGKSVLWNPGCDHAGIATQVVVEKKLKQQSNLTRHDVGRDAFIEEVWKWKNEKGVAIYEQMKRLGISVDWDRAFFTMDPGLSRSVIEAFVQLYNKELVYRAKRLVNWSCALKSAISDIEIDKMTIKGRQLLVVPGYDQKIEFGVLIEFAYKLKDTDEQIIVATTRIETMLGDVAIAVHPDDTRYKHLIGKLAIHPFCNRLIPIVSDSSVDISFGTGAVKITPAHDQNDYEIAARCNLPHINIFTDEGLIADNLDFIPEYNEFKGMKRFIARIVVIKHLTKLGLFVRKSDHAYVIPICNRSKDIIEPILKSQWYIKCSGMASKALDAVRLEELVITPSNHIKTWNMWMENIQDWCVSRQLWWGHRIPAYYVTSSLLPDSNRDNDNYWVCARSMDEALSIASDKFKINPSDLTLTPDEDVLDTWFSSGLLPFSVFGWPNDSQDISKFYPTTLLETGYDILFFWVARMVMLSLELTNRLPFKTVLLHTIVRDSQGRKMSKSLGNIVDPVDVIQGIPLQQLQEKLITYNLDPSELNTAKCGQTKSFPSGIPECGTDALRFSLCDYSSSRKDINMDVLKVQSCRFFCNKIWNAFRFATSNLPKDYVPQPVNIDSISLIDKWILSKLACAETTINHAFSTYDLSTATNALYSLWVHDFCDVYIEWLKFVFSSSDSTTTEISRNVMFTILDNSLRMLHPFMPYLTEELYQRLPFPGNHFDVNPSICVSPYPHNLKYKDETINTDMVLILETIDRIRSNKDEYVPTKTKIPVYIHCHASETLRVFQSYNQLMVILSHASLITLTMTLSDIPSKGMVCSNDPICDIYLQLKDVLDVSKELVKTNDQIASITDQITKINNQINTPTYLTKVPTDIQTKNTNKLCDLNKELQKLNKLMQTLKTVE